MDFDAVIFDCDGTLVDSEPPGFAGIISAARTVGVQFADEHDIIHLKGSSMAETLRTVEERRGRALPADFEKTVRAHMAAAFREGLQPMPGARELLERLAQLGVPYCIASNGPREKMELTLTLTELLPLLHDRLYSAHEVGSFKPEPGLFLHAAQAMGVAPARCALVEDSAPGVVAGLAAGMPVWVLKSPQALPAELHARVRHLDRLLDLLD